MDCVSRAENQGVLSGRDRLRRAPDGRGNNWFGTGHRLHNHASERLPVNAGVDHNVQSPDCGRWLVNKSCKAGARFQTELTGEISQLIHTHLAALGIVEWAADDITSNSRFFLDH